MGHSKQETIHSRYRARVHDFASASGNNALERKICDRCVNLWIFWRSASDISTERDQLFRAVLLDEEINHCLGKIVFRFWSGWLGVTGVEYHILLSRHIAFPVVKLIV